MNALNKIKNVTNGLTCCSSHHSCNGCPYKSTEGCSGQLDRDALEVINALRDELKKRTSKTPEIKPGFIMLTTGTAYSSDGIITMLTKNGRTAVRVDDILWISDLVGVLGSSIRLNDSQQTTFCVCETIEEILGKIAEMKGELYLENTQINELRPDAHRQSTMGQF